MATINGTSVGGMTLQIDYSYTQNTTANTTSVTLQLQRWYSPLYFVYMNNRSGASFLQPKFH